ncbi:MAG: hypothetical protein OXN89_13730 [Bryobacterales bacterium]|nr:hypothetical protein [Bryobacterales bacterium]
MQVLRDWGQLIALAVLMVGLVSWLRSDIGRLETRIDTRLTRIEAQLSALTERVAHIEGRLSAQPQPAATDGPGKP